MDRSLTCALEHGLCPPIHKGPQPRQPTVGHLPCALSGIGEWDFFNPKPGVEPPTWVPLHPPTTRLKDRWQNRSYCKQLENKDSRLNYNVSWVSAMLQHTKKDGNSTTATMNEPECKWKKIKQYLLAFVHERDNVIILWARETIDSDLMAQNSAEDFQSWNKHVIRI
jgi:hypothetical protein